ncbi:MAG TPA: MCP four helix bundle domain-containing protein [Verrucomicrobiae bacterium]|nr:MCP four helix bundle domain-containing protein [Verrucomicrobiae bacterium]
MSNLRRLKPVVVAVACLVLIGWTGFMIVSRLKNDAAAIVDDTLPGLVYAGQIDSELSENFARTLLVINSDSPENRDLYLKRIEEGSKRVNDSMSGYERSIYEEQDRQLFSHLTALREKYQEVRRRVFDLVKGEKRNEALRLLEAELLPAYAAQKEAGEALFDYNVRQGNQRGTRIELVCRRTQWIVTALCVAVFVGGFFVPFFAIRLPPNIWK